MRTTAIFVTLSLGVGAAMADESVAHTDSSAVPVFNISDCYRAMWADERSSLAKIRFGVGKDPIPLSLRATKDKINAKEKQSLAFVSEAQQHCQKLDAPNRINWYPPYARIVALFEQNMVDIHTKLYSAEMTWGEAVRENERNSSEFQAKLTDVAAAYKEAVAAQERQAAAAKSRLEAELAASRQADAERQYQQSRLEQMDRERQQRASQQQFMNGLMLLNAASQPRGVNCTSTQFGNTVNTNCR